MNKELKKAVFEFMNDNNDFQLVNSTIGKFRQYIYTEEGNYCFGGEQVVNFIIELNELLKK
jgi:hypothetical protein